ncbi:MAG: hypothetical protein BWK78_05435 [Thiotrichaceae bacterium IS1]|nr:MAG: hypothetical protein BWK78_05435 [Thiotrichaceae bacterium IS1]
MKVVMNVSLWFWILFLASLVGVSYLIYEGGSDFGSIPDSLWVALGLYWSYCIWQGLSKSLGNETARDGSLSGWVFMLAAIATCYSGWTFISHPAQVYRDGFPGAYASLYAITIPLSGLFFLKRQWILGKRYGFVTPTQMFSIYFKSRWIGIFVFIVALLYSVAYIAVQLRASGFLFYVLTDGKVTVEAGMYMLSLVVVTYVILGGLRGVAYVDTMQSILLAIGIVILGIFVLWGIGGGKAFADSSLYQKYQQEAWVKWALFLAIIFITSVVWWQLRKWFHGNTVTATWITIVSITLVMLVFGIWYGWEPLTNGITKLVNFQESFSKRLTSDGISHYVAIPNNLYGFGEWGGKEATAKSMGSYWTMIMVWSFLIALMGIQTSPAFSMWALSNKEPRYFAHQQVLASSFIIGAILIFFTVIQGVGGHLLGADAAFREYSPATVNNLTGVLLDDEDITVHYRETGVEEALVPLLIRLTADISDKMSGWLMALLAICALAAIQSTAASYMVTFGSMFSHDCVRPIAKFLAKKKILKPSDLRSVGNQIAWARIGTIVVTGVALYVASKWGDTMASLGSAAVAFGLQMVPALIGLCWMPFFTSRGIVWGLGVGILVVLLAEGMPIMGLGFGKWPLTIHSAVWGLFFNIIVVGFVSLFFRDETEEKHRQTYHQLLETHAGLPEDWKWKKHLIWFIPLLWSMVFLGPGIMLVYGMPSIWVWQILGWFCGVVMMWYLAYKMGLSTEPEGEVEPLEK